jgi:hypothetical protein
VSKLHEILAVEGDLEGLYKRILEETKTTFDKKTDHFIGFHKRCEMFDAGEQTKAPDDEHKELVTTVYKKLDYLAEHVTRYLDCVLQKETTNQLAKADIVLDNKLLAKDVPVGFLLGLETKLKAIRLVIESAPTLQPGVAWERDVTLGDDIYKAKYPETKVKTAKTFMHKVLVAPTDKHPAQVEKWEEQVPVGKYITDFVCGMISPAEKSILLGRTDKLLQAVKQARQRANMEEVTQANIGNQIFTYILGN